MKTTVLRGGNEVIFSGIADEAGKSIAQQISAHKKLGWDHIEIRNVDSVNLTRVPEATFDEIKEKLDEAGMKVSCFASEIANWARKIGGDFKNDEDDLRQAIPRMKKLNTKYIRVMSYPNDGRDESEWHREVLKRLKDLTKIAEGEGIILAHENCSGWGGLSAENCRTLIEEVNSPAFRVLFDTGNPTAEDPKQDSWEFYNTVKQYIVYIHIKDTKREGDSKRFTFPGQGDSYVRRIISDLKSSGYEDVVSIEPHMAAVVHEGKEAEDSSKATEIYLNYGRELGKIVKEV